MLCRGWVMLGVLSAFALGLAGIANAGTNANTGGDPPGHYAVNQPYDIEFTYTQALGESWEGHELFSSINLEPYTPKDVTSYDHVVTWHVVNEVAADVSWRDDAKYVVPPNVSTTITVSAETYYYVSP